MIPISEAIDIIKAKTGSLGSEKIALGESVGRILAQDIVADTDMPPFDRSQMDGFAVIAKDTKKTPVSLKIVGESAAGRGWHKELRSGQAVRIMTGAPVPKGADAVQKVELTKEDGETVTILEGAIHGKNIVRQGDEVKKGTKIFSKGELIKPNMIASLAAFGYSKVKVAKRPKVAILSTGSEIVSINKKPKKDQIRNSNSVMLRALCEQDSCLVKPLPITKDDISKLRNQIANAAKRVDILVITGGVSVGKYDLTKAALNDLGAEIFFERVQLKPGKPAVFAKLGKTLVFGLPGNPVSSAVTYSLFVRVAVMLMQKALQTELPQGFAVAGKDLKALKERDTYLPAALQTDKTGRLVAEPQKWIGSSDFIGYARAVALIVVPKGTNFAAGEVVKIVYL
jgi:molybdopterin molybdotransferase